MRRGRYGNKKRGLANGEGVISHEYKGRQFVSEEHTGYNSVRLLAKEGMDLLWRRPGYLFPGTVWRILRRKPEGSHHRLDFRLL